MVKRKRIALIFRYDENWIGGSYYILNLIQALNVLDDNLKPELLILAAPEDFARIKSLKYPYLSYKNIIPSFSLFEKIFDKFCFLLTGRKFTKKYIQSSEIDILFPASNEDLFCMISQNKRLFWIPDFQSHNIPALFNNIEYEKISKILKDIVANKQPIVFSSYDSHNDFIKFYPSAENKTYILHFAVTLPNYSHINKTDLFKKYNIDKPFFICSNQFWEHKNHIVVLKAAKILKERRMKFYIIFTGKEYDHRNPEYIYFLKNFVITNQLNDIVKFLGFIDRCEQLKLMSESIAILQPSLSEGWSTVVEDSKAIGANIILSDINIHKEQISTNAVFFNPYDEYDLADKIQSFKRNVSLINYGENIIKFSKGFLDISNQFDQ